MDPRGTKPANEIRLTPHYSGLPAIGTEAEQATGGLSLLLGCFDVSRIPPIWVDPATTPGKRCFFETLHRETIVEITPIATIP